MPFNIYSVIYFIEDLKSLIPFIDSLGVQEICDKCESKVYLKTINRNIKKLLLKEPNFVRIGLDKKVYAIFRVPKKFEHAVNIINKTGLRGVTKDELLLFNNKKASDTKCTWGYFYLIIPIKGSILIVSVSEK